MPEFRLADPSVAVSTFRQLQADAEEYRRQADQQRQQKEGRQLDERLRSTLRDFDPNAPMETEAGTGRQTLPPAQALEQRVGGALAQSPGGGEALMNLRMQQAQRGQEEEQARALREQERQDEAEERFHDLMKDGQVDLARNFNAQNQLGVPDEVFESAEKARDFGTVLDLVKGNQHDPQYGGRLIENFVKTGSIEKAIQASGRPTPKQAGSQSEPGQLQMIRWLQETGVAATPEEAFQMTQQGKGSAERVATKLTEAFAEQYPPPSREEITEYYQQTLSALQAGGTQPRATEGAPGAGTTQVGQTGQPQLPRGEAGAAAPQGAQVPPEVERRFRQQTIEAPVESFFPQGSEVPAQWRARQQQAQQQTGGVSQQPQATPQTPRPQQPTVPAQPQQQGQTQGQTGQTQGQTPSGQTGTRENPARPTTLEEFEQLPPGYFYFDPGDGRVYQLQG